MPKQKEMNIHEHHEKKKHAAHDEEIESCLCNMCTAHGEKEEQDQERHDRLTACADNYRHCSCTADRNYNQRLMARLLT